MTEATDEIPPRAAPEVARVAVVVVNYRIADLVIDGVQSVVDRDHGGREVTVHVVDNASGGTDVGRLRAAHAARGWGTQVTIRAEAVNHGFGRGNDVVIRPLLAGSRPPDAVMLLNPDARLDNEAVDILARALEDDARAGVVGPAIVGPGGAPVPAAFRFPTAASEFSDTLNLGFVARRLAHRSQILAADHPGGPVDWVSGAAAMMRADALRDLNGFDPDFFLYYEEVDLMRRARAAGWRCLYVPEARVLHEEGVSTGVTDKAWAVPRRPAYFYESWALYHRKAAGRAGALGRAAARAAGAVGNRALGSLPRRRSIVPERFLRDFWRHAVRPLLRG
ncbi:glycosyltransferase [Jannaschia sp. LMIT008]|uniref:glycosyltransferase n=1 Tax=Jannaschia maritima TaxID=3032585 RepID=UPI0028110836|nr:glycosyltransferase [Jannaschia sp. LMIT008]